MEEDVNSANIDNCQNNRNKKKPGIRNFFRNGKETQIKTKNINVTNALLLNV